MQTVCRCTGAVLHTLHQNLRRSSRSALDVNNYDFSSVTVKMTACVRGARIYRDYVTLEQLKT